MQEKTRKFRIFSVKTTIVLSVFVAVLMTMSFCLFALIPRFKEILSNSVENNMLNLATSYGTMLNIELEEEGEKLSTEELTELLHGIKVQGVESSYAYLVASDGTMLYHPTVQKIGQPVENAIVNELVKKIQQGNILDDGVKKYEFNGVMKYASFHIMSADHSILVVTADEEDIFDDLNKIYQRTASIAIIIILTMGVLSYLVGAYIAKPIKRLTNAIKIIADFDFKERQEIKKLIKRKDETGIMSTALENMRKKLQMILVDISNISQNSSVSAVELEKIASEVYQNSSSNSATSEQLAASMQETSVSTEMIDKNLLDMGEKATGIKKLAIQSEDLAKVMKERAQTLCLTTEKTNDNAKDVYFDIKKRASLAVEQAKSVEKINLLAETIGEIASQTNLLSLNASIEAARAGESGRGFAVVASEIGSLASQSTQTVNNITKIVQEVKQSVANMSNCLETSLNFLDSTILKDYTNFIQVSSQYKEDTTLVDEGMLQIKNAMEQLDKRMNEITTSISAISSTITESAVGVTDIAEKNSDTVLLTSKTFKTAEESAIYAEKLKEIVERFQL